MLGLDARDQGFGLDTLSLRFEHDGCPVCVVGPDPLAVMTHQALVTYPDIGLDVFEQVTDM